MTARILVTGSRRFADADMALTALSEVRWLLGPDLTIVHGGARGADQLLAGLAEDRGMGTERHEPAWAGPCRSSCRPGHRRKRRDGSDYCPAAGDYRNQLMVDLGAAVCIACLVPRSVSPCTGTRDCARRAKTAGIPVRWYAQEAA